MKSTAQVVLAPYCKLWLSSAQAQGVFGDGKWRLLQAVEREGSLRAAAERMGISYRKAWGDLQKAEKWLSVALVERQRGGSAGGTMRLTAMGRRWVEAYAQYRNDVETAIGRAFATHLEELMR